MKILKIAVISFLLLIFVLTAAFIIFLKTFDINRFKPQIISQAGSVLNRKVDFEKARLVFSLRGGVSLGVSNLVIAEDPAFAKKACLTAKDISLSIDVLGYLFQRKVNISGVLIEGFRVTIIRQKDGSLNVQSIAQPAEGKVQEQEPGKVSALPALPAILIASLKGSNGEVAYSDRTFEPPLELVVSDLNFALSKISLTGRFPFTLECSVLSAQRNIRAEGQAKFDLGTNEVTLSDVKGETDLKEILLEKIPVSFPMTKGAVLPASLSGTARLSVEKMTAGPKGLVAFAGEAWLENGSLKFAQMAVPLKNAQLHAKITQEKILLNEFSASLGEGAIKGQGSLDEYLTKQKFKMAAEINNVQLEDLIAQDMLPVKAKGAASGQMQLKGQGFTPAALSSYLSGTGSIALKKMVLKDINVFQLVMAKLSMIPGLAEKFEASVPERYKKALVEKDTALSDIALPVTIENGRLIIKDTVLSAEAFSLKSSEEVGFDGSYAMEGTFLIPGELSAGMITKIPELQYLLNEEEQIFVPLKVSGNAAGIKLNVDAGYIAQKLLVNQAKTQLLKMIDRAVGPKDPSPEPLTNQ